MSHRARSLHRTGALAAASLVALAACAPDGTPTGLEAPSAQPSAQLSAQPSASVAGVGGGRPDFVPGELLVKFRAGASEEARGRALRVANATAAERILTASMRRGGDGEGLTLVRTGLGVPDAVAALRGSPDVVYAEPNWVYTTDAVNDPYFTNGSLWGMYGAATTPANQFGSGAAAAWARGAGDCGTVWVGIIDEGYMFSHADLAPNAGVNPGEIAGNGRDDDGNGYVDDVRGWDFDRNDGTVFDGTSDDHGTHVAGTIGGAGNNGTGVVGVCQRVKLFGAKFLGRNGGTTANAIRAVDYFTDLKTRHGLNLVATNNSWGGGGFSQGLQDAIARANAAGILFVAAAGNSTVNCDTGSCFPAEYQVPNVIAVASITSTGGISSFSNFGAQTIHLGAPGSGIWSTVPGRGGASSYASYSGTSMATPHVAGAAALYASRNPGATAAQIKTAILNAATPTTSLAGRTISGGRLNVAGF